MIRTQEDRQALQAEKRAKFLALKEAIGEGRIAPTPRKGFTPKQRADVIVAADGRCQLCDVQVGLSFDIDHIEPLFRGGLHEPSNWRLLCKPCHLEVTKAQASENASIRRIEDRIINGAKPSRMKSRGFEKGRKTAWPKRSFGGRR